MSDPDKVENVKRFYKGYFERQGIKPSAPLIINADRGPKGGWMYREELMKDTEYQYIRSDLIFGMLEKSGVDVDGVLSKFKASLDVPKQENLK